MGSVFSPPKPPAPAAITYTPPPTQQPSAGTGTASVSPEADAAIRGVFAKRNRGLGGTVLTSWQGALASNDLRPRRNNLLGE